MSSGFRVKSCRANLLCDMNRVSHTRSTNLISSCSLQKGLLLYLLMALAGIQLLGLWGLPTPWPQAGAVVSHRSPPWLLWDALMDAGLCLKAAWLSTVGQLQRGFGNLGSSGQRGETPAAAPLLLPQPEPPDLQP